MNKNTNTTKTGRTPIGPQISAKIPKEDVEALNRLAAEHGANQPDEVRAAIRAYIETHLGPGPVTPTVAARAAELGAQAWEADGGMIVRAISEANAIVAIHSPDDAETDLSPVWEAVVLAKENGLVWPDQWAKGLAAYADLVRSHTLWGEPSHDLEREFWPEYMSVVVDAVDWHLTIRVGGPEGAMRDATYRWKFDRGASPRYERSIQSYAEMVGDVPMDPWAAASHLVMGYRARIPAQALTDAVPLLEHATMAVPREVITAWLTEWEQDRNREARRALGETQEPRLWGGEQLARWERTLLNREPAWADPDRDVHERFDLQAQARQEVAEAFDAAVERELEQMVADEREREEAHTERERELKREQARGKRNYSAYTKPAPAPEDDGPADWEIELGLA